MSYSIQNERLAELYFRLDGDLYDDYAWRVMYATDASVYRDIPIAVARPKSTDDIVELIRFATKEKLSLIPRTAGTSIAGQVVGKGIVVDVSKYMNHIIELNEKQQWVRVQPGVVLDELNQYLKPYGLFFSPETSTSNRCMIGGMVGNNSCGAHSLIYGSTRDHVISIKTLLSDGSEAEFKALTKEEFHDKCKGSTLESKIYQQIQSILSNPQNQQEIINEYPDPALDRRNTGYALDLLLNTQPFEATSKPFNFCKILCGSEGTLAFTTEVKLNLIPLPSKKKTLLCAHFNNIEEALEANLIALKYKPIAIELIDRMLISCTAHHVEHQHNCFFIQGDPEAVLIIEFASDDLSETNKTIKNLIEELHSNKLGYHYPTISGDDINKVWALRKAGLGLLTTMPGDIKAVSVIEDTAIPVNQLVSYIKEFKLLLSKHNLTCAYYGHIATGELHLKPILNLKDPKDVERFYSIALDTAKLVKKYRGSISGEHGDGRLRGQFIPLMIGEKNYALIKEIKLTWDSNNIFNPGKIIDTEPMNTSLRYAPWQITKEIKTFFDFSKTQGFIHAIEQCNGSADCRKSDKIGGLMCPTYMATLDENNTTRARANILREFLTHSTKKNRFNHKEIYKILEDCLACKGCKIECPSAIDMSKIKSESLQQYYLSNLIPLRIKTIANIHFFNQVGSLFPKLHNAFLKNKAASFIIKYFLHFSHKRSLPTIGKITLKKWAQRYLKNINPATLTKGKVYLFIDEFTNYNDVEVGIKCIKLLTHLGYQAIVPKHTISGRTFISKGLLKRAKRIAQKNVLLLKDVVSEETPLIGIEPSAILAFRDEYLDLVDKSIRTSAIDLSKNCLLVDEFIMKECKKGNINKVDFSDEKKHIKLHGHCHQKAIAKTEATLLMLSIPHNFCVEEMPTACCGMAGVFGYEENHYELSIKIGNLVLFPSIKNTSPSIIIVAPGVSCRQQIKDGTGRIAFHPIEVLYDALKIKL